MPKRKHPRRSIGGTRRPKGGVPMPEGGYALPARQPHDKVYVTSVINENPDMRRLARTLVDWAKQECGYNERAIIPRSDAPPAELEQASSGRPPSPPRSQ